MKKKSLLLFLMTLTISSFALTACGEEQLTRTSRHAIDEDESEDEDEDEADDEEDDEDENESTGRAASAGSAKIFVGDIISFEADPEFDSVAYDQHYELHVNEDGTAAFLEIMENEGGTFTYTYEGKYTFDSDKSEYIIETIDSCGAPTSLIVSVDGSSVVDYDYEYSSENDYDFSGLIGSYTADTECGEVSFTVDEDGLVDDVVLVDGVEVEGSLILYGEHQNYDLMFTDPADEYHDWYIYPNGNSFDYEDYNDAYDRERQEKYIEYAGDYEYSGALGDITITVSAEGASTSLNVNGAKMELEGGVIDFYDNEISSVSFFVDEGMSVNIYLYSDGTYSVDMYYSGY